MSPKIKKTPTAIRREQIARELEKLELPKQQKTRRDFKSDEAFENWKQRQQQKKYELNEELSILDNPFEYNELPLALAAEELNISLDDMQAIVQEELIEINFSGEYRAGARITREELARTSGIGASELLRVAYQTAKDVFEEALEFMRAGDLPPVERALERMESFSYDSSWNYWLALEVAVSLMRGSYEDLKNAFSFRYHEEEAIIAILHSVRRAVEAIEPANHLCAALKERILAVTEGKKAAPFEDSYKSYETTEFFSQMDENQRHSMFLTTVIMESIETYKFKQWIKTTRGKSVELKKEELERMIRNALFTALEAESTYYDSPSSKLLVDRIVELFPQRWIPAKRIALVPKKEKPDPKYKDLDAGDE